MGRFASRELKSYPNGVFDAPTEGDRCARTAIWDRWYHRFEADTEAGLGRTRFIRVCLMVCSAHTCVLQPLQLSPRAIRTIVISRR